MAEASSGVGGEAAHGDSITLEHVTVEYENAPGACTVYPRDCSEADLTTRWITAKEGSFVDLEERR